MDASDDPLPAPRHRGGRAPNRSRARTVAEARGWARGRRRLAARPRSRPAMNPTISLGRVAGVKIGLNWSWAIVFALIVWSLASAVFPDQDPGLSKGAYAGMAVAAALLFFGSLLLHELGHAVQARRDGIEIEGITLWLFGGVARFKDEFPSAGAELRGLPEAADGVAAWLGYINFFLLAFNLLPALPLDGGRVLRATLWAGKH